MLAFDAKRAFQNSSGLGNYSRTHLLNIQRFFPEEDLLLFTPKLKIPFLGASDHVHIEQPSGLLATSVGASYWRSYRIAELAEKRKARIFHGLSNELPMNIHRCGLKKIVTIHDLIFLRYPEYYSRWDRSIYHKKVAYACQAADVIICISEQTRQDLDTYYKVPSGKTELLYQDCSDRFHTLASAEALTDLRARYRLVRPYVLSVGTPELRKKQNRLLEAFEHLSNPDMDLIIVGRKTEYQKDLEQLASQMKCKAQIRFLNDVPTEDLPAFYRGAELSVYLSEYEGFGLPVIESLNQGVPVLCSERSCLPEAGGEGAVYVNPDNLEEVASGMKALLADSALRQTKTTAGLQHVLRFRADHSRAHWQRIYEIGNSAS